MTPLGFGWAGLFFCRRLRSHIRMDPDLGEKVG